MNIEKMINTENMYLFRHNTNVYILTGQQLRDTMNYLEGYGFVVLRDIAGNYYRAPWAQSDVVEYQELYRIKSIEIE